MRRIKSDYIKYIFFVLALMAFLFAISLCERILFKRHSPVAVDGILDLREWDFDTDGAAPLSGMWELYWEQRLSPKAFKEKESSLKPILTNIYS